MKLLIGADPEVFLRDQVTGKWTISCGKFGGTKEYPIPIKALGNGYAYQEDNVALEYNIPPCSNPASWVNANKKALNYLESMAKEKNLELAIESAVEFHPDDLKHEKAWIFGCDPDFNAWTLEINPRPHSTNPYLRAAGGHIHVGIKLPKPLIIEFVRLMDLTAGLLDVVWDPHSRRRELYGQPGSFRYKKYGVEYRVMGNSWLKSNKRMDSVYYCVLMAYANLTKNKKNKLLPYKEALKCYEHGDTTNALDILKSMGISVAEEDYGV